MNGDNGVSEATAQSDVGMTRTELEALCQAANAGDQQARTRLTEWLDSEPGVWQSLGDLGKRTELTLRNAITAGDFLQSECLLRSADALRKSLLPEDATPLEELSVQRLVIAWHQVQHAEERLAMVDVGHTRNTFWIRAVDSANRRFDSAMSQLLTLRKVLGRAACRTAIEDVLGRTVDGDNEQLDKGAQQRSRPASASVGSTRPNVSQAGSTPEVQESDATEHRNNALVPHDAADELSSIIKFKVG